MTKPLQDLKAYLRFLVQSGACHQEVSTPITSPMAQTPAPSNPEGNPIQSPPKTQPDPPSPENDQITKLQQLEILAQETQACRACPLGFTRTQAVPGVGNPNARLLLIGEAPGAKEDAQGQPFVGPAGKLLTQALEAAGLRRDQVFIANVLKCRPPNNRDPLPNEIQACQTFLHRQIQIIQPQYLCALGRIAAAMLLNRTVSIMKERGTWTTYHHHPLFLSLHPSAVLHNPSHRDLFFRDIKTLVQLTQSPPEETPARS